MGAGRGHSPRLRSLNRLEPRDQQVAVAEHAERVHEVRRAEDVPLPRQRRRIEAEEPHRLHPAGQQMREADRELARQRSILSPEAYAKKRGELEQRVASLQREARNRKRGLDKIFARGMTKVQAELAGVAKEIAEERGLDLILSKATVVLVKAKFELTQEAVRRLNERLPDLPVAQPEN